MEGSHTPSADSGPVPVAVQPPASIPLCKDCQALSLRDLTPGQIVNEKLEKCKPEYVRQDMFPDLLQLAETAAATGCVFCHFLRETILSALEDEIMDELRAEPDGVPVEIGNVTFEFQGKDTLQIDYQFQDRSPNTLYLDIAADRGACVEPFEMERRHVPAELFSDAGMMNVRKFLGKALAASPPPAEVVEVPTRLIDVGDRSDQDEPRIVIANEHAPPRDSAPTDVEQRKYVALSYCWGGAQDQDCFLKTETKTLPEWKQRIPLKRFPRTLRDAVLLTGRLGVRYNLD